MQVGSRRCVLNPASGTADHADYVTPLLEARGFEVLETKSAAHATELGREAGRDGVSTLAVCGGDGTVNHVLRGLVEVDALAAVALAVVPAGTANLLARNLGIDTLEKGIEVADTGTVRTVDVGVAAGSPFVVSCIAGLPADASTSTSAALKERFGTLAFLVTGARETLEFEGLDICLEAVGSDGAVTAWEGEAMAVLVGNARKFVEEGGQADMEDGLFDVTVVEQMPAGGMVAEAIAHRLLRRETGGVTHFQARSVRVESNEGLITFSLDGEVSTHDAVDIDLRPAALDLRVGDGYEPAPE